MTEFLTETARKRILVTYSDALEQVSDYGSYYGPNDQRLWHLLGLISENEIDAGKPAIGNRRS